MIFGDRNVGEGMEDGFHNKVQVLDSGVPVFYFDEEARKIRQNKTLNDEKKQKLIDDLNRQYDTVYFRYCGIINSFPYKTKKASDRYIDEKISKVSG